MQIKKSSLVKALEVVKPGLGNNAIIEQSDYYAFKDGRVFTYNDSVSISYPLPEWQFEGAIKAEQMVKLIGKWKKEEIEMEFRDNEIVIKSGRAEAGFRLTNSIALPMHHLTEEKRWKVLPEGFCEALKKCAVTCSRDMSRPVLTGVQIAPTGELVGSDGFRLLQVIISKFSIPAFIIPATAALQVISLKPTHIAMGKTWVYFKNEEGAEISCNIFFDDYPNIQSLLTMKGISLNLPNTLQEVLEKASIMGKQDHFLDEVVVLTLQENRLHIRSESEAGWFKETMNCKYSDEPIEFAITPILLMDILKETRECVVGEGKILFNGENWKYVAVLREV